MKARENVRVQTKLFIEGKSSWRKIFFSQSRSVEITIQMKDRSVRKLISYFCFRYYFRVQNMIPGVTYKFNIINLLKNDSLYNYGKWTFLKELIADVNTGFVELFSSGLRTRLGRSEIDAEVQEDRNSSLRAINVCQNLSAGTGPGSRFSKVLNTFQARKASCQTGIHLFSLKS